ncbi:MAG: ABC transporter permease subunit [Pseudomonadota bacterium]
MGWSRRITILLPYLWLLAFFLMPFLIVLKISISEPAVAQPPYAPVWDSFEAIVQHLSTFETYNFEFLFEDPLYVNSYLTSLRIAGISTVLALLVGYPIAYGIARCSPSWRGPLLALVILPFWTSFLIRVYSWIGILSGEGLLNGALIGLGIISEPLLLYPSSFAVYVGIVYSYLPFMILPLYAALEKLDGSLLEASADLGARPTVTFITVTLPLSLPGVIAGSFLVFIPAVGEYVIPELLGGSGTQMIGKTLYSEFFQNRDWPLASAVAVLLLLILILPIVVFQHFAARDTGAAKPKPTEKAGALTMVSRALFGWIQAGVQVLAQALGRVVLRLARSIGAFGGRVRRGPGPLLRALLALGLVFLYAPIVILVVYSFNASQLVSVWGGWSLRWYGELFQNEQLLDAVWVSISVAAAASTIATILGTMAGFALARVPRFLGRTLFSGMVLAPLVMPEVITGLSLLLTFIALGIDRGFGTLVIAHATFSLCYVAVVVQARLAGFDRSVEEAAADLGARPATIFRRVTLPLILPGVVAGWLLSFTLSLDDLVIASFTTGPGATTLPMKIFSAVRLGVTPEINAVATILIGLVALGTIVWSVSLKRALARAA